MYRMYSGRNWLSVCFFFGPTFPSKETHTFMMSDFCSWSKTASTFGTSPHSASSAGRIPPLELFSPGVGLLLSVRCVNC